MTNIVAKHPRVFSFFYFFFVFIFFFVFTFFFAYIKRGRNPFMVSGTQNYRYNKSSSRNTISNIVSSKNKKEEKNNNINPYLNLFVVVRKYGKDRQSKT